MSECKLQFVADSPITVVCVFINNAVDVLTYPQTTRPLILGLENVNDIATIKAQINGELEDLPGFGRSLQTPYWYNGRIVDYAQLTKATSRLKTISRNNTTITDPYVVYILWNLTQRINDLPKILKRFNEEKSSFKRLRNQSQAITNLKFINYTKAFEGECVDSSSVPSKGCRDPVTEQPVGFFREARLKKCIKDQTQALRVKIGTGVVGGLGAIGLVALLAKYGKHPKLTEMLDVSEELSERAGRARKRYLAAQQQDMKRYEEGMVRGQRHINKITSQIAEDAHRHQVQRQVRERLGKQQRNFFGRAQ